MLTPYDWQEGVGHRAQYVENKLSQGTPVLAISIEEGILMLAFRRSARKIYEIYDRLAFGGVGLQSDIEALRVAAIDFAHQEGFNRSEQDVTIQRVVSALSSPVKKAFADFASAPFVARSLFAEVAEKPEQDTFAILDFDGDFTTRRRFAWVAGTDDVGKEIESKLTSLSARKLTLKEAKKGLAEAWKLAEEDDAEKEELTEEIILLERSDARENRFSVLEGAD